MLRPLSAALAIALASAAEAATLIVDTADDGSIAAHCSMRDAVAAANTDLAVSGCPAGNGADTIVFASGIIEIVLDGAAGGELLSDGALTTDGGNARVTLRRDADDVPFRIVDARGSLQTPLRLHRMTISGGLGGTDGSGGGGIFAEGPLDLDDCIVSGNLSHVAGGGIYAFTTLTMVDSVVSGNATQGPYGTGGGIHVSELADISDSSITGNSTDGYIGRGGGIYATLTVNLTHSVVSRNSTVGDRADSGGVRASQLHATDSLISDNSSGYGGGGVGAFSATLLRSTVSGNQATLSPFGRGGGIEAEGVYLTDSSINDNSAAADGGGLFAGGGVEITGSTIAGNSTIGESHFDNEGGGGIFSYRAFIANSTISGNSTAGDIAGGGGIATFTLMLDNSTISDNSAAGANGLGNGVLLLHGYAPSGNHGNGADIDADQTVSAVGARNLVDAAGANVTLPGDTLDCDPQLQPLADNGGLTLTHALGAGSCAIDAGTNFDALVFDQRGAPFVRVRGDAPDIGAFEQVIQDAIFSDGFDAAG
ncbi:MAG: choice-of-anchor Q domain-containing protein [Dokdonella sp.]